MTTKIATHNSGFHPDDVFAMAAITILYQDYIIYRTRDENIWQECDFLIDVGKEYNHEKKHYDHHFKDGPAYEDGLLMSSVGLIWKHYGLEICNGKKHISDYICNRLIRGIDANDNGITSTTKCDEYDNIIPLSLCDSIKMQNPIDTAQTDSVFEKKVCHARDLIKAMIANCEYEDECRIIVQTAIDSAIEKGKNYIVVPENCEWMKPLFQCTDNEKVLYTIYPKENSWYIKTIPVELGSFESKKDLPEEWHGLNDDEFSAKANITDGIFCHHKGFICGAESYESIIKLAEQL
ncbi:MAG: MYG1 family protein [Kiritimatiellae bacterium]|jgi:uncharacterized UPF0160 family protein|nr:MYG1 family protein [Kiritimatiellia bacterium]